MFRFATTCIVAAGTLVLFGCANDRPVEAPRTPFVYTVTVYDETGDPYGDPGVRDDVVPVAGIDDVGIDDRIAKLCQIPEPQFAFDSARIQRRLEPTLNLLAHCLNAGALKDASIRLVGHADERGTERHNFALGTRRAESIAEYLIAAGVSAARIETSSRGELDAAGSGPEGWQDDRRVEIQLRE